MKAYMQRFPFLVVILVLSHACIQVEKPNDLWEYPVKIGDSRASVHEITNLEPNLSDGFEEYAPFGISIFYRRDIVAGIFFMGCSSDLYTEMADLYGDPSERNKHDWMPTDKPIYAGLTIISRESDFKQILGQTFREAFMFENTMSVNDWRLNGYNLDAGFLTTDFTIKNKVFKKGSLVYLYINKDYSSK